MKESRLFHVTQSYGSRGHSISMDPLLSISPIKKNHHCSNIWYYIFLLLDLEIIWSFQIFYFHFIMGLLAHDLESFYKGLGKELHHFSG